jgi:hypothetical protein
MTELLDYALEAVRLLSPRDQDEIARVILQLAGSEQPVAPLSCNEHGAIVRSKAAAEHGEFATDEQVQAVWAQAWPIEMHHFPRLLTSAIAVTDDGTRPPRSRYLQSIRLPRTQVG